MAAKLLAKSFVSSLSKAIPPPPLLRRELSRVFFCSASSQLLDTSDEQDKRDSRVDFTGASRAVETGESAKERAKDYANDTKQKTKEMGDSMADKAEDTKDKVEEEAYNVKEKAEETAETLTEKAKKTVKEAWGTAKEKSRQVKESVMGPDKEDGERESHG